MAEYQNFGKLSKFNLIDKIKERDTRITKLHDKITELFQQIDDQKGEIKQLKQDLADQRELWIKDEPQ